MNLLISLAILLGLVLIAFIAIYNGLVRLNNNCKESWSGISVQLKRRHELIPNLVATVKGYAKHESQTFEMVTKARNAAISSSNMQDIGASENMLSSALKSLFAVAENYPDLKANQNFLELQRDLTDTEDKISASRRFYNSTVRELNTKIESFPSNLIAGLFNFKQRNFFQLDESEKDAAQKPVEVKLDN